MLEIDATKVSPQIAQILALSGWGVPPLNWADRHNATAKSILEANEDGDLFKPQEVRDEAMATAVRALLYLWTGWPSDGQMWSAAAPEKERLYISALAHRQLGQIDESKSQMQQLEDNPLSDGLSKVVKDLIGDRADVLLKRFRDLIELGNAWEAFAFTDLLEQARDGEFSHGGHDIVCKLQWQEFNMLLQRCYEAATGIDITKRQAHAVVKETEPAWKRNISQTRRPPPSKPPAAKAADKAADKAGKADQEADRPDSKSKQIGIKCPKCKTTTVVSESARGHQVKCSKCAKLLQVAPAGGGKGDKAAPAKTTSRLVCPKCRSVASYSVAHRGKKVACLKCRTSFLFAA